MKELFRANRAQYGSWQSIAWALDVMRMIRNLTHQHTVVLLCWFVANIIGFSSADVGWYCRRTNAILQGEERVNEKSKRVPVAAEERLTRLAQSTRTY